LNRDDEESAVGFEFVAQSFAPALLLQRKLRKGAKFCGIEPSRRLVAGNVFHGPRVTRHGSRFFRCGSILARRHFIVTLN
jgi:hypothetical protein